MMALLMTRSTSLAATSGGGNLSFDFSVPRTISLRGSPTWCLDAQNSCKIAPCDTRLFVWECNGHASQQWLFDTGSYKLRWAPDPTKCVDGGNNLSVGTETYLWACNGLSQQKFGYDPKAGTIFFYDSAPTLASLCLDTGGHVAFGNRVTVAECTASPQQQLNVFWGTTIRLWEHYNSCLDLPNGRATQGALLQIWDCNGFANQQWILDPNKRRVIYGGEVNNQLYCLDGGTLAGGNRLMIWPCNGLKQQNWGYDPVQRTVYLPQTEADASLCMDLYNGDWRNGHAIQIWQCNMCWNQQWTVGMGFKPITREAMSNLGGGMPHSLVMLSRGHPFASVAQVFLNASARAGGAVHVGTCPPLSPVPKSCGKARWTEAEVDAWHAVANTCKGGWPVFASASELVASPWCTYFKGIYGEIPNSHFPICIGDFRFVYKNVMAAIKLNAPKAIPSCPSTPTDAQEYSYHAPHALPSVNAIYHSRGTCCGAAPAHTWIEVTHSAVPGDEKCGSWFYRATGTGIWFYTGNTISFPDHTDCVAKLGQVKTGTCTTGDEQMSHAAALKGYDSIQFLNHDDTGTNDQCCKAAGGGAPTQPCRIEVVATKLAGRYACTDTAHGASLRAGWQASRPCQCVEGLNNGYINCKGVPITAMLPPQAAEARAATLKAALNRLPQNRTHADLMNAIAAIPPYMPPYSYGD